jgi:hypothetical protein
MFLVQIGLFPDNLFILKTNEEKIEARLREKHTDSNIIKNAIDEYELNIKPVREVFKGHFAEINTLGRKKSEIIEEMDVRSYIKIDDCEI